MSDERDPIVVVTGNKGKAAEIEAITGYLVEAVNLDIQEVQSLDVEVVAKEKALAAYRQLSRPVVVDDTGMTIEALKGLPGALVSWFLDTLGPEGIVRLIVGESNRKASVSTCIGYADATGAYTFVGTIYGALTTEPRGAGGFGYDPIFVPDGQDRTYAEMTSEEKNAQSMRKEALIKFRDFLGSRG